MGFGTMGLFVVSGVSISIVPLPLPGSTDLLLILLVVHHADPVFAALAAIGGSILWVSHLERRLQRRKSVLPCRYLPTRFARRLTGWVEKNGTLAVSASASLPPPFPLMPFLLASGAFGVSRRKFLISFGLARAFRYSLVTWLALAYGRAMVRAFRHYLSGWSTILMWAYFLALWWRPFCTGSGNFGVKIEVRRSHRPPRLARISEAARFEDLSWQIPKVTSPSGGGRHLR